VYDAAVSCLVTPLDRHPGHESLLRAAAPGAAILEGWSDDAGWRLYLPWPEEIRLLEPARAAEWKEFVRAVERDATPADSDSPIPFTGGWVGFISYEAFAAGEDARPPDSDTPEPAAFFALHRAGIAVDPGGRAFLFAPAADAERRLDLLDEFRATPALPAPAADAIRDSLGGGAHASAVGRIREAIRDGDVYQVNLTRAWSASGRFDPADLYTALAGGTPPRSSALLHGDGWAIASASPEVLLRFDRGRGIADSRPIKGTVRREGDDAAEIAQLLGSGKDASEHLMIVDVVRNDFGKIVPAGSVTVARFCAVRSLEHVHHLESTVVASNLLDASVADVLAALSPAASITGAPKRAAVAAIRDLEPVPRGVYCGSIGFIAAGRSEFSVAIRTAVVAGDSVRYHAGGGIVWDSDAAAEDDECRAKAEAFLRFVGGAP
jgi:anthranilate synthase component I